MARVRSSRPGLVVTPALLVACGLIEPASVCGQACQERGLEIEGDLEVMPADGATGVARNARVVVRYRDDVDLSALEAMLTSEAGADNLCAGQLACLVVHEASPREVAVAIERQGSRIELSPRSPLAVEVEYSVLIVQPDLDRVARVRRSFTTGTHSDREPPVLAIRDDDVEVRVVSPPPQCDAEPGSRRVQLRVPAAGDDGDPESVELQLTLIEARGLREPELRARARPSGDRVRLAFLLSAREARDRVCVALEAIDGVGRVSEREHRLCFDPRASPDFGSACSAAQVGGAPTRGVLGGHAWAVGLLAALAALCARVVPRFFGGQRRRAQVPVQARVQTRATRARPSLGAGRMAPGRVLLASDTLRPRESTTLLAPH